MAVTVTIVNWQKFNPRADVGNPTWYRLSRDLLISMQTNRWQDVLAWLAILAEACRTQKSCVSVCEVSNAALAKQPVNDFILSIRNLEASGMIEIVSLPKATTLRARNAGVTATYPNSTIQNSKKEKTESNKRSSASPPPSPNGDSLTKTEPEPKVDLVATWNANRGDLPEARRATKARALKIKARLREQPDEAYWVATIKRLASSSFACGGNDRAWQADFTWLVKNDENHVKVNEGKYDDRGKMRLQAAPFFQREVIKRVESLEELERDCGVRK